MEDPVKDIEGVVRSLTQGSPNEQAAALNRYFVPNAEFVHPFCRVPPFQDVSLPLLGQTNSRQLLLAVLRWYRILSPRIDLQVNSVLFDPSNNRLYVDINQRFAFWFLPLAVANVNLVSRLSLVQAGGGGYGHGHSHSHASSRRQLTAAGDGWTTVTDDHHHGGQQNLARVIRNGESPSFAAVAASSDGPLLAGGGHHQSDGEGGGGYLIAKQEDLYQVNEFVKFVAPFGVGDALVSAWHLFATAMCVVGAAALFPFVWVLTNRGEGGNVMPPVERGDDGRVVFDGVGAEWAGRAFSPLSSIGSSAVRGVVVNLQANVGPLVEKGEALASNAQKRARGVINDVQARQEALVGTAQEKATRLADKAQHRAKGVIHEVQSREDALVGAAQQKARGLADTVQQKTEGFVQTAQEKGETLLDAAQKKEVELVRGAQAKEEQLVGNLQSSEERAAENTKQWWAANKKG
ncbi:hypothetical protein CONLIGDRAFT_712505 [Coniochaeta ligniaria NRRL 30616]|uniref:SigF-like NTF2-like domain-containing protein n=1 Tax=Coniochaeta ligniaria NRRL 30616 TaxID=1408157 RepID=A0A1J7JRW4_9PEZI|nr:hypothetical protein CONLIGDRAFT_712505 [Coniochaeta ligniaria NRRL 30616]